MIRTVLVRVDSHRAADNLARLLQGVGWDSGTLDWHYTWADGGTFVKIPAELLTQARAIAGVTRARAKGEVHRCVVGGGY